MDFSFIDISANPIIQKIYSFFLLISFLIFQIILLSMMLTSKIFYNEPHPSHEDRISANDSNSLTTGICLQSCILSSNYHRMHYSLLLSAGSLSKAPLPCGMLRSKARLSNYHNLDLAITVPKDGCQYCDRCRYQ